MIRAKPWNGKDLKGTWEVTIKIDGVRALRKDASSPWVSRAGKPLYNLPTGYPNLLDCEVYVGSFKDTIRAVRTPSPKNTGCKLKRCKCRAEFAHLDMVHRDTCKNWQEATPLIKPEHLYGLDPLDERLNWGVMGNPTKADIETAMEEIVAKGYEGLVLRQRSAQGVRWLKVKPMETHDVLVTGAIEGTGKHKGRLGALMTPKGNVGTGFSNEERESYWEWFQQGELGLRDASGNKLLGSTIEVSCMSFTPDGKFRHPRFVRLRPDKVADE